MNDTLQLTPEQMQFKIRYTEAKRKMLATLVELKNPHIRGKIVEVFILETKSKMEEYGLIPKAA